MNNLSKCLLLTSAAFALGGCFEAHVSTDKLCEKRPDLQCEKLNINDGQCRVERTNLIWHRKESLKDASAENKIAEYNLMSKYRQCMELATQITPIGQEELKRTRLNALVYSIKELDSLIKQIRNYNDAESLYFLWSQTGDNAARDKFIQMEGSPALETAHLQYALATYYTNRDPIKTIHLLNHSLELTKKGDKINTDALQSLASLNQKQKRRERAYVWTMVAKNFQVTVAAHGQLKMLFPFTEIRFKELDDVAKTITNALKSGSYKASMLTQDIH